MQLERMLSTGEVARRLGVSQVAVRQWVAKGRLGCTLTSLGRLFDLEEVDRFARSRELGEGSRFSEPDRLGLPEVGDSSGVKLGE